MSEESNKTKNSLWRNIALLIFGVPLLYTLSVGPAVWCRGHGMISEEAYELTFSPLVWVISQWEPLYWAVDEYACFWQGF